MDEKVRRKYLLMDLNEWNKKIYEDENGEFVGGGLDPEELWNTFQIKSWPKFKDACSYRIPAKWADDIRTLLKATQQELGDRIEFGQIKEKFCYLTIYYEAKDDEADKRFKELKAECVSRLIEKGIHRKQGT